MRRFVYPRGGAFLAASLLFAASAAGQPTLTLPEASPEAPVNQTVGLTQLRITYHRPSVNKRTITDEAIEIFRKNVKDHPESWNVYDSLGEAYEKKGDKKLAAENYRKAQGMVRDPEQKRRIDGVLKKLGT